MECDGEDAAQDAALLRQIEFYFSDANLSKDRHMAKKIAEDDNGYVPLSHIATFNCVKRLVACATDADAPEDTVVKWLGKALYGSQLLKVSDDGSMVKRATPVVVTDPKLVNKRTIFAENLGDLDTHDKLAAHFGTVGEAVYISLPRFKKGRRPKGFAFIEYSNTKDAKRALKELNQFNPADPATEGRLRIITKVHWVELRKQYMIKMARLRSGRQDGSESANEDVGATTEPTKEEVADDAGAADDVEMGVLIRVLGVDPKATKSDIIECLGIDAGTVRYVDHKRGKPNAIVRFYTPVQVQKAMASKKNATDVGIELLQDDEELEYWEVIKSKRAKKTGRNVNPKANGKDQVPKGSSAQATNDGADRTLATDGNGASKRPRNAFEAHGVSSHLSFLSDDDDDDNVKETKRSRTA